jgi:hypothetical protein
MKCHAERIQAEQRIKKSYQEAGGNLLAFIDASVGVILHEQCGCAQKRLQRFYDGATKLVSNAVDFYDKTAEKLSRPTFEIATFSLCELSECGFDYKAINEELPFHDRFFDKWRSEPDRQKHATRLDFIRRIAVASDTYYSNALLFVRREYKYGKDRLTKVYKPMREDYNRYVEQYLLCNEKGDRECLRLINERQEHLTALGLELTDL